MKIISAIVILCLPAFGQAAYSGPGLYSGAAASGSGGAPIFFAALPQYWVDNSICNPPGGAYDVTVILGTTNNIGPNIAGSSIGQPYALTPAGLMDAANNWRDNADNGSQTPHFSDKWWLIEVPHGTVLHGIPVNSNTPLISLPGKVNGGAEPAKCLVIDSDTPLTAGVMACGHGLPGFGGVRNPGCSSPNDKAALWTVQLDAPLPATGETAVYAGQDPVTSTNWVNHIVVRDVEVTLAPGAAQSHSGAHAPKLFDVGANPLGTIPCNGCQAVTHFGLDRYYIHGNDPGDAGQPAGACSSWAATGTVTVTPDGSNPGTSLVTYSTGSYYGMTFTVGSTVNLGGTNYSIANTSYTQGVLTGAQNTQFSITGTPSISGTVTLTQSNPPSQYANGCGDDVQNGVLFNCDYCWRQNGYIEKIHWWNSESHASIQGFANGPYKDVNNWEEGGSATWFSGGGPVDNNGGPGSNNEIRRNYLGRDLNFRQLSANAGNSPAPPWGCASTDGTASHNTCPFQWSIKNSMELKLGHYNVIDGNIVENSWADAQAGNGLVVNARTCSGGQSCGVFNPTTGLPSTYVDNIRISNNWIRNIPQPLSISSRSGSPGNGGGVSLPVKNLDFINNLISNVSDTNQFGNPGHDWNWTSGQDRYPCTMSYTGSGPYTVTAICLPSQSAPNDPSEKITKIASVLNVVTLYDSQRTDPILCTSGNTATCIANGQTVIVSNQPGWNGTFAMSGTSGNWAADGTGGQNIIYTDNLNSPGTATLCDNSGNPTCSSLLGADDITFASLGYKMTDISVGDDVYASDVGGGDTTCSANGYAVGTNSATYAITGTIPTGLTVVYSLPAGHQPTSPSAQCIINNGAGFPKSVTVQNNTILSPNIFDINAVNSWWQPVSNYFFNNVFATNDSGTISDVYCAAYATEGTAAFNCWDSNTLEFYQNVLVGRSSANWSVVNCPGGSCANAFPPAVNCSASSADPSCLGYTAFMGSSPTLTYPSGACAYDGSNPFNCPLMALPWANNFTYTNVSYVGSSSYSTQGVSTTKLHDAMTQAEYVCPTGANCGTHGPYPD